jgi:hypothetical protein
MLYLYTYTVSSMYSKHTRMLNTCEESITITFTPASASAANRVLSSGRVPIAAPHTSCLFESCDVYTTCNMHKSMLLVSTQTHSSRQYTTD